MKKTNQKKKGLLGIVVLLVTLVIGCFLIFNEHQTKQKFTVTFDTVGGNKIETIEVEKGKTIKLPEHPHKEGYIFIGWELNGKTFKENTKITENITLTAVWNEVTLKEMITITFNSNGGNDIEPMIIEKGQELKNLPIPKKDGYNFITWEDKNSTPIYEGALLSDNIELFAVWEKTEVKKIYYCDKGYTLNGTKCTKTETINAKETQEYTCPEGYHKTEKNCTKTTTIDGTISNCTGEVIIHPVDGAICRTTTTTNATIEYKCPEGYATSDNKMCVSATGRTEPVIKEYTCPSGYNKAGKNCTKTNNRKFTPAYSCPSGYTQDESKCHKTETIDATSKTIYTCENDYTLSNNKCTKIITVNAKVK